MKQQSSINKTLDKFKISRVVPIFFFMLHVISWSGGKDSTATVILMHEHLNELVAKGDEVKILFAEIMFDKENDISGIYPETIEFIKQKAEIFKNWGFDVEILRGETDFLDFFHHRLKTSPDPNRIGLVNGFPIGIRGKCSIKRDGKLKPIAKWNKEHENEEQIHYVGIAIDESARLESIHKKTNTISLLEKYGLTEIDAMNLCKKYDMVSPQYKLNNGKQNRDGCWFCPHAKLCEHEAIMKSHPQAWEQYVSLENIPNLAYPKWNPYTGETLHERDEKIRRGYKQLSIFDFIK